jgi:GAF domain-containing protein
MNKIEVFGANTHVENPYVIGETAKLQSGLYCETVMKTGRRLMITNAIKDKNWSDNPDIARKMIAYMGLPIYWPRGEVFGTICLLNSREHHFSELEMEFIQAVHDAIESDLAKIYQQYCIDYHCEPKVAETTVASRI